MTRTWKGAVGAMTIAFAAACGGGPERAENAVGTSGTGATEVTLTGCLALGQMGIYMLAPEEALPDERGFGRSAATEGYQLLGQPDDFNQYMNKRVRVTGTRSVEARSERDTDIPAGARDTSGTTPWPKVQVQRVESLGEECR
jgi:hypothetical protein